jgi:hypothetical protein
VGLPVSGSKPSPISGSMLSDYIDYLEYFAQGYSILHPTTVTSVDSDLLTISGPQPSNAGTASNGNSSITYAWQFYCSNSGTWVPLPSDHQIDHTCGVAASRPVRARVSFSLDPWGRLNDSITRQPFRYRFNDRWVKFAVNLAGSNVIDCSEDPTLDCVGSTFVEYDFLHFGPAWTTDYYEEWRSLGIPLQRVERGLAIAAERVLTRFDWLNPPNNTLVGTVARQEFADGPFGGTYWLELNPTENPNVRLANIQYLQILISEGYWTRQQ